MTAPRPTMLPLHLLAVLFALLVAVPSAIGQGISARIGSTEVFVDEPFRVAVTVADVEGFDGPTFEPVPGIEITRLPGEQTSTSFQSINGRTTQRRSVAMTFEAIVRSEGPHTIPAFRIVANGVEYASPPIVVRAAKAEQQDLVRVRVVGEPRAVYLGQRGSMNLEICVKRYSDQALGITLDEASMWSLIDIQGSSWGLFGSALQKLAQEGRRPRGELRVVDGAECYVFTLEREFDPIATGTPVVGDVRIRMEYPTRLQRGRDFFMANRLSVAASRTLSVAPDSIELAVLPIPEGGRPASWNGAVGDFEILVVAKPVEVAVGDPITLTMRLTDRSGTAALEGLLPPRLGAQDAIRAGFRVPTDPAGGTTEGRSKIFTQSIRALDDSITEIPAIEFSYFDPVRGGFGTIKSAPIAISVKPSAMVRVAGSDAASGDDATSAALTTVSGGLVANMSVDEASARRTVTVVEWSVVSAVGAALWLSPWLLGIVSRGVDPRRERWRGAPARFEAAISAGSDAAAIEAAMLAFIAHRLGSDAGGFSRKDALDGLRGAGATEPLLSETDSFLRACERARYLGGSVEADEARRLANSLEAATDHAPGGRSGGAA